MFINLIFVIAFIIFLILLLIVYFNGNGMDLSETAEYSIKHPKNIQSIKSSLGTMVEISYQKQTVEYAVESNSNAYPELVNKKS
jgi:hypothetical protein